MSDPNTRRLACSANQLWGGKTHFVSFSSLGENGFHHYLTTGYVFYTNICYPHVGLKNPGKPTAFEGLITVKESYKYMYGDSLHV